VRHAGALLDQRLGRILERESGVNPRYQWLGELSRPEAQRLLAASQVLLHTSRHEGGANVVSEALAAGVPLLATRIPGTVGILGEEYPGYFGVGDARGAATALARAEADRHFFQELKQWCDRLKSLVSPERERASWARLVGSLAGSCGPEGRGWDSIGRC
jgi:glycosyltransferase involved in cell wall biosynthesis